MSTFFFLYFSLDTQLTFNREKTIYIKDKLDMKYYFYKTTNNVDGKYYYGVHSTNTKTGEDSYLGSGTLLCKAIRKYGKKNFSKEILKEFNSMEEAYAYEAEHITLEQVKDPNCYNVQTGGLGGPMGTVFMHRGEEMIKVFPEQVPELLEKGWERGRTEACVKKYYRAHFTEEHKKKISEAHKGKPSPLRGRKLSEERIRQMSESRKGKPSGMLGKKQSEDTKEKIRQSHLGKPRPQWVIDKIRETRLSNNKPGTTLGRSAVWKDGKKRYVKQEDLQKFLENRYTLTKKESLNNGNTI